jgi:hypothetical protein
LGCTFAVDFGKDANFQVNKSAQDSAIGFPRIKGTFKMRDKETMWYENYEPVQEYLDREFPKKPGDKEKDPKTARFSWLEIMKKSFHNK